MLWRRRIIWLSCLVFRWGNRSSESLGGFSRVTKLEEVESAWRSDRGSVKCHALFDPLSRPRPPKLIIGRRLSVSWLSIHISMGHLPAPGIWGTVMNVTCSFLNWKIITPTNAKHFKGVFLKNKTEGTWPRLELVWGRGEGVCVCGGGHEGGKGRRMWWCHRQEFTFWK